MVHLVGKTEFELETFAATMYGIARLEVQKPVDVSSWMLSHDEKVLAAMMQTVNPNDDPIEKRLRDEHQALRFLSYTFLFEYQSVLYPHLKASCLDWTLLPGDKACVVQGRLNDWLDAIFKGTQSDDPMVLQPFCQIYLYLQSVVGLNCVLSRFFKDAFTVDGDRYFRLRYQ